MPYNWLMAIRVRPFAGMFEVIESRTGAVLATHWTAKEAHQWAKLERDARRPARHSAARRRSGNGLMDWLL